MKLLQLAKSYDFNFETDFFDYCIDSFLNGQYEQAELLFKEMDKLGRKCLLIYINDMTILPADKRNLYNFYFNLL